jgi:hypothetical protein
MKANEGILLSFVFIYFSESGFFKGLQPKKTKKSFPIRLACEVVHGPSQRPYFFFSPALRARA